MPHSNWVEIELAAIENNVRYFSDSSDVNVMAVVKANAYGHGSLPVVETALRAGASWCGVSRADEALELRSDGIVGRRSLEMIMAVYQSQLEGNRLVPFPIKMTESGVQALRDAGRFVDKIER